MKENIVRKPGFIIRNKSEIGNPPWASVVINARAFSVWEEAFALQWDIIGWYYYYYYMLIKINCYFNEVFFKVSGCKLLYNRYNYLMNYNVSIEECLGDRLDYT